jgi:methionine synthase II (cobalamin-independent)
MASDVRRPRIDPPFRAEHVGSLLRPQALLAARFVDMSRLCLSPQCGFASSSEVDRFTADDEERKLAHLVSATGKIWA